MVSKGSERNESGYQESCGVRACRSFAETTLPRQQIDRLCSPDLSIPSRASDRSNPKKLGISETIRETHFPGHAPESGRELSEIW
jgi:hypothetical protein